jgi:Spy/CpxP family protein refolding chaperone
MINKPVNQASAIESQYPIGTHLKEISMLKRFQTLLLFASIAAATTFGNQTVFADDTATVPTPVQGQNLSKLYGGNHLVNLSKQLGFSAQQNSQLQTILSTSQPQAASLIVSQLTANNGLQGLIQSGTVDVAAINAQSAVVIAAESSLAVLQAQEFVQFLALLTPTQVTGLNSIQAAQQAKFLKLIATIAANSQQ